MLMSDDALVDIANRQLKRDSNERQPQALSEIAAKTLRQKCTLTHP